MPLIKAERIADGKTVWVYSETLNTETHKPLGEVKPKAKPRKKANAKAD